MAKKVTLEMTETQARIVLAAVEEWFRLRMGQGRDLTDGLAFMGYKHDEKNRGEFDERITRRDCLDSLMRAVFDVAFPWKLHGISKPLDPEVHIASDIWSQLRWELSTKEEWMSTPFQMGAEPMVKVTVEEE